MKLTFCLLLGSSILALTGCINVSLGNRRNPPTPPIVVPSAPLNPGDAATVAEIDAAGRLNFDSAKKESLTQLAQRPGLSPAAQVHVVAVAYRTISSDSAKMDVLRAVIANPSFSDAGRQAIVSQLDHLSFDSHRQEILRQLNQRVSGM